MKEMGAAAAAGRQRRDRMRESEERGREGQTEKRIEFGRRGKKKEKSRAASHYYQ